MTADADRYVPGATAALGPVAHGLFDHAVLQGMKGDDRQAPAHGQPGQNLIQKAPQFAQLVIDGHA